MSWPASILDRSSTSLIRPSRCLPLLSTRLSTAAHLLRRLAVDAVQDQLGVAEDGVERRAQLVAHVGEELRLVLARLGELAALVLDFVEQPHVLDRDHRLVGEGRDQLDLLVGERPHARCASAPARRSARLRAAAARRAWCGSRRACCASARCIPDRPGRREYGSMRPSSSAPADAVPRPARPDASLDDSPRYSGGKP